MVGQVWLRYWVAMMKSSAWKVVSATWWKEMRDRRSAMRTGKYVYCICPAMASSRPCTVVSLLSLDPVPRVPERAGYPGAVVLANDGRQMDAGGGVSVGWRAAVA